MMRPWCRDCKALYMGSSPIVASLPLTRYHAWSGVIFVVARESSGVRRGTPKCAETQDAERFLREVHTDRVRGLWMIHATLRRHSPSGPTNSSCSAGACRVDPPRIPKREMTFLKLGRGDPSRRGAQRALPDADLRRRRVQIAGSACDLRCRPERSQPSDSVVRCR